MIKFQEQVPSIYPKASRDFQYLCWLINIVLNSVKHNVDDLYSLPNVKTDTRLSELLAMTLGFKVKRNYDQKQLAALVAVLPRILKYKGTQTAIEIAGKALIAASGAVGSFIIKTPIKGELEVTLPKNLIDVSLFTDLLPYILPAGMSCHIVRTNQVSERFATELTHQDIMISKLVKDLDLNSDTQAQIGLAQLFDTDHDLIDFANFTSERDLDGNIFDPRDLSERINFGLLENTIIPMLVEPLDDPKSRPIQEET